ncbi:LTA synthase family protein [Microbulbifer bruguierae]|uniref:LTA synthase family protein n=1 Tax=Microbulbifer bruguierae TaxID=3029061 RepID=A0ABY8NDL3_9GAMM|nr:LTA synthase family protein [Microbulbifer bruguierae]WGL16903.1 LTA synthase family protein [Microbulbifer bruguierae]
MYRHRALVVTGKFIACTLLVLLASRLYLCIAYFDRIGSFSGVIEIVLNGIRVDLVLMGYLYTLPLLAGIWISDGKRSRYFSRLLMAWLLLALVLVVFLEVVTPEFIREYDIRPNRLFIDYLIYPHEVFSMLWQGYKLAIAWSVGGVALALLLGRKLLAGTELLGEPGSVGRKVVLTVVVVLVSLFATRSSLQHRPFNPSMVYFSNDNLVNSFVLNSAYSVLYAVYNTSSEAQASDLYGRMSYEDVIASVRLGADQSGIPFESSEIPTLRDHLASNSGTRKNIVILLQESLGARFVGNLGGEDLTPNLDVLMEKGWQFTHAYATGTRSVRGIEAVFTGFSPGPSRSVVKLDKSQTDFFTLASFLQSRDYFTQFIYGGESHFDNMKSFFLGNGVEDVRDLATFSNPGFVGSWGASDQDLYREVHQQFLTLNQRSQPFFSLVFTTSNHSPWEYPDGCPASYAGDRASRENAIRYADCALGEFIRKAEKSNYWKDTIFLVIADHDSRVHGSNLVPIDHFRIPALILGGGVEAKVDDRLVSQIDFPTTLLSLAGVSGAHPMLGFDLSRDVPVDKQRAMLQYGENFSWLGVDHAVILRPHLPPKVYSHDGHHLLKELDPREYAEEILHVRGNALWSNLAYSSKLYRQPKTL